MRRLIYAIIIAAITVAVVQADGPDKKSRRHIAPINNQSTQTQAINETKNDTSRINAAIRAASTHYSREDGAIVYVDTVTGEQWIDSATINSIKRMDYPLIYNVNIGVDIWDPIMRLFGQKYGLIGFSADLNMYNRFFPTFEMGLGSAKNTPSDRNFTYRSPMSAYFKIGMSYNFLYKSNSDYQWLIGVRYGFAPFKWAVDDISLSNDFWGESSTFNVPEQNSTAGWIEVGMGLRVKLFKNISAGWMIRFHSLLHESKSMHGEPWYIPGYGSRKGAITGSFSFTYTIPINKKISEIEILPDDETPPADTIPSAEVSR